MTDEPSTAAPRVPVRKDPTGRKYGIAVIANDKVLHWLLPFLESHRQTNAALPVYLIPYDDNHAKTRKVADIYGAIFSNIDSRELDALSKRLYPVSFGKRFRLRKLLSLALPLDEVIHLDADIVLFRDMRPFLGFIEPGDTDFIIIAKTLDYVYNKARDDYDYLRDATLFNDGFFITSNEVLTVQDFYDAMAEDEATFHKVRQRGGLFAQPLTNFVTHRKRLKIKPIFDLVDTTSGESWHGARNISFDEDGPRDWEGKLIYFCHWPGVTGVPRGGLFDKAWRDFADRAAKRVQDSGVVL